MTLNLRDTESRDAQSRQKTKRHWNSATQLSLPEPPDGYRWRWVRYEIRGEDDTKNVVSRLRQGYEMASKEDLPEEFVSHVLPDGQYKGAVCVGDLILMKAPVELVKEREAYVEQRTERLQDSVDATLMSGQNPAMPLTKENRSSVTRGRPDFQEE